MIAVAVGLGSVWALDSGSTLYRIDPGRARVTKRIQLGASAAYNIWIGAGAVWIADDQGARAPPGLPVDEQGRRADPGRRRPGRHGLPRRPRRGRSPTATTPCSGSTRSTNHATRLGIVGGSDAAAERLALLGDGLWITGRGLGLVEMDPTSGATRRTVDIGGTGIDVVSAAGALWVPVRTAAVDRTGLPTMTAVRRVGADGSVKTVATARGRVDVHGLAAGLGSVWIADNTSGLLYRLAT